MTPGTIERRYADPRGRCGRKTLLPHPPAHVDDPTSGSLEQPADSTSTPATRLSPEATAPRDHEGGLDEEPSFADHVDAHTEGAFTCA